MKVQEEKASEPLDAMGNTFTTAHIKRYIYLTLMTDHVMRDRPCRDCRQTGTTTLEFKKQFRALLERSAVRCHCPHCGLKYSLGFIAGDAPKTIKVIRTYIDTPNRVETVCEISTHDLTQKIVLKHV